MPSRVRDGNLGMKSHWQGLHGALGVVLMITAAVAGESPTATAWMGVLLGDAVDGGVQVVAVMPGGPAERARLQRGDLILEADGRTVAAQQMLRELLASRRPGDARGH